LWDRNIEDYHDSHCDYEYDDNDYEYNSDDDDYKYNDDSDYKYDDNVNYNGYYEGWNAYDDEYDCNAGRVGSLAEGIIDYTQW